jgi:hypothetical protein
LTNASEMIGYPPIGFIVEGHEEYHCYPSLVCRIINAHGINVPRANAKGTGNIIRHLEEHLDDIVASRHPHHVLVSVDLKDNIDDEFKDCESLRSYLIKQTVQWLNKAGSNPRLQPLPASIAVVIQIPQFESWMLADIKNLKGSGHFIIEEDHIPDVDSQISNPAAWLKERNVSGRRLKDPRFAKEIITKLDPNVMRQNSKSFDKFSRETIIAYHNWCQICGINTLN